MYKLLVAGSASISDAEFIAKKLDKMTGLIQAPIDVTVTGFGNEFPRAVRQWINDHGHTDRGSLDYKGVDGAVLFWDGRSADVSMVRNALRPGQYRLIRPDNPQ